jgi:hypothetical protein
MLSLGSEIAEPLELSFGGRFGCPDAMFNRKSPRKNITDTVKKVIFRRGCLDRKVFVQITKMKTPGKFEKSGEESTVSLSSLEW